MPAGPRGEKRPADVIGNAVKIAKIATGEIEDVPHKHPAKVKGGKAGAKARTTLLTRERRVEIAKSAATARWSDAHAKDAVDAKQDKRSGRSR